jgi:hypothetical protein
MVSRGIDINSLDARGNPAIMVAIKEGAWQVYDFLAADRRTDVNIENRMGETPLMYLAVVGDTRRAQALIKRGAQVNRLGWTPLQYAASRGHLDTVKMLLANGAQVNAPGPDGTTALMMAAFSGEQTIVQTLLDAGADPTMSTLQKQSAGDWARKRGFNDLGAKLDAVEKRVLAYRDALRQQNNQVQTFGLSTPWQSDPKPVEGKKTDIKPPDMRLDAVSSAVPAKAAKPAGSGVRAGSEDDDQGQGTSRYFDLKRFDEKASP